MAQGSTPKNFMVATNPMGPLPAHRGSPYPNLGCQGVPQKPPQGSPLPPAPCTPKRGFGGASHLEEDLVDVGAQAELAQEPPEGVEGELLRGDRLALGAPQKFRGGTQPPPDPLPSPPKPPRSPPKPWWNPQEIIGQQHPSKKWYEPPQNGMDPPKMGWTPPKIGMDPPKNGTSTPKIFPPPKMAWAPPKPSWGTPKKRTPQN